MPRLTSALLAITALAFSISPAAAGDPPPAIGGGGDIITGAGAQLTHVKAFDGTTGAERASFFAYPGTTAGVRVAAGDITGDGLADFLTGTDSSAPNGHVKVFDGQSGVEVRSFFAFPGFAGGVYVASGDVNGDGRADIVTGADAGGNPHVKVFDGLTNAPLASFFAYGPTFAGGVRVAAGDINGDSYDDIITGAGAGAPGGHVKVFDGQSGAELRSFFAFEGFAGGVYVAAGDVNGDGFTDIITGAGGGAGGHVKAFDGQSGLLLSSFFAYPTTFTGGVRVASADVNGDLVDDIITGTGPGTAGGHVKVFNGQTLQELRSFVAYGGNFDGGIYVAGAPDSVIPEPASGTLLIAGMAGLAIVRRRKFAEK